MKKKFLTMLLLAVSMMSASCGRGDEAQESGTRQDVSSEGSRQAEAGDVISENGEQPESGSGMPEGGNSPSGGTEDDEQAQKEKEAAGAGEVQEDVLLSDKLLKTGDTMEILYFVSGDSLAPGLEITLGEATLSGSPEEAHLDRALMMEETENYDLSEEPFFCSIDEAGILTCDLTVKNVNVEQGDQLHIGEIMVAYADPATGKVSILSSMPVYFSASSSAVGKSDYYHYAIPKGESREMTVAWLIPEEYEAENLYLGVEYDVRKPEERQYFRLFGQE